MEVEVDIIVRGDWDADENDEGDHAAAPGTEKDDAELRKFSSSRSKEVASCLKELALARINRRSASAESRTSLHPLDMKEMAFSAVADVDGRGSAARFIISSTGAAQSAFPFLPPSLWLGFPTGRGERAKERQRIGAAER